jgi:hypothetical protein
LGAKKGRRRYEYFQKAGTNNRSCKFSLCGERGDRRNNYDMTGALKHLCDVSDPANVLDPVGI